MFRVLHVQSPLSLRGVFFRSQVWIIEHGMQLDKSKLELLQAMQLMVYTQHVHVFGAGNDALVWSEGVLFWMREVDEPA